eukprot:1138989-Pelagomonas_calceolata.AAC.2
MPIDACTYEWRTLSVLGSTAASRRVLHAKRNVAASLCNAQKPSDSSTSRAVWIADRAVAGKSVKDRTGAACIAHVNTAKQSVHCTCEQSEAECDGQQQQATPRVRQAAVSNDNEKEKCMRIASKSRQGHGRSRCVCAP